MAAQASTIHGSKGSEVRDSHCGWFAVVEIEVYKNITLNNKLDLFFNEVNILVATLRFLYFVTPI